MIGYNNRYSAESSVKYCLLRFKRSLGLAVFVYTLNALSNLT